ncbi:MFS transporter [Secundilactobacillus hailunensis]|uniref:MFS transporter n=1 Tax=Secundilactobacillus hailunensis TaxID=2559923 RepID=A0ABW1TC33_9LACO|nr:MFS transporter [Secundilactobacillus hailunensis]
MSKYRLQAVVFVLVAFMLGCNEFMVVGVLSDIASHLHVSIALVGYLVTIFATVYAVSTPFITILTSKYSRYKTLLVLMVVFLIGNTLSGLATNYWSMLVSRVITAAVAGSIISLIMTFTTVVAPREKRANLVSWVSAGFSIAAVIGIPIGTTISTNYGWRYAFYAVSVITVMIFFLLVWLLPKHVKQVQGSIKGQLSLLKDRRIYLAAMLVLFTAAAMYGYYTYIRPLLTTTLGFSNASLNILLFIIGFMSIISTRWSGRIADHGGLRVIPKYYVINTIFLVLLPLALSTKATGLTLLLMISLIVTIFNTPVQIHFLNVAERNYPQSLVLASSLYSIFFNFGISLGSATSSVLVGTIGLKNISLGSAVYALISLGLIIGLNRAIKARKASRQNLSA